MYQLGEKALKVSMSLFALNRQNLLNRLRKLPNLPKSSFVVLEGGKSQTRHDTDHEDLFRQVKFIIFYIYINFKIKIFYFFSKKE